MENTKVKKLYGIIGVLGLAVAVFPWSVYRLIEVRQFIEMEGLTVYLILKCHIPNNLGMICRSAWIATAIIGSAIVAIVFLALFFLNKTNILISALLFAAGIAAVTVVRFFPLCSSVKLACRYLTAPVLTSLGAAIIILSVVLIAMQIISISKASVTA